MKSSLVKHIYTKYEQNESRERERERENCWNETTEPLHLFSLENGMPLDINRILRHEDMGEVF